MKLTDEPNPFWLDEETDAHMEEEHGFIWQAMLAAVDLDLRSTRVLDVGCSQGGFLRLLADQAGIGEGFGYDPAAGSVEIATALRGSRPLRFETGETVPAGWEAFDVAFSHEVLYLLHDLDEHASAMRQALLPGGVYYVVMGTHDRNPMMPAWHRAYSERMSMPPIYGLEDVIRSFTELDFEASVRRLPYGFIPAADHLDGGLLTWLDYYYEHKVMLRFARH